MYYWLKRSPKAKINITASADKIQYRYWSKSIICDIWQWNHNNSFPKWHIFIHKWHNIINTEFSNGVNYLVFLPAVLLNIWHNFSKPSISSIQQFLSKPIAELCPISAASISLEVQILLTWSPNKNHITQRPQ